MYESVESNESFQMPGSILMSWCMCCNVWECGKKCEFSSAWIYINELLYVL